MRTVMVARPLRCIAIVFAGLLVCSIVNPATVLAAAPDAVSVGRVTGMVDCRWADAKTDEHSNLSSVRLGETFALSSGLLEITYDAGARVILQGPCDYVVDSRTSGRLSLGKLTARVERTSVGKKEKGEKRAERRKGNAASQRSAIGNDKPPSPLFSIRTPTAVIADLGADLGVEMGIAVDKSGGSRVQLFRGAVELRTVGDGKNAEAVRLEDNESARVEIGKDRVATIVRGAGQPTYVIRVMPKRQPLAAKDKDGFTPMFNGKDLTGWEGEPGYWSVEDGAITGTTTAAKPLDHPSYLFWKGGKPADFELRASFRFVTPDGNSGINFRSQRLPKWDVKGYQADMETGPNYTGILYECNQREIVALRGQKVVIHEDGHRDVTKFADAAELQKRIKRNDWNQYTIVARGPEIVFTINGVEMCRVVDKQQGKAAAKGCITLQIHPGPPMKVQFKNIRIKNL